ncbi:MAG: DUF1610 domain-containing protein [Nanoarchaeota archaeon]|nr:DUF1610 domain-containing protein [Nanoarchaeota archaeon]
MTTEKRVCVSCNDDITSSTKSVEFKCPNCGEVIRRCGRCRKTMVKWVCKCGFEGP